MPVSENIKKLMKHFLLLSKQEKTQSSWLQSGLVLTKRMAAKIEANAEVVCEKKSKCGWMGQQEKVINL